MKIPSSEIQGNTNSNHPQGEFSSTIIACVGELTPENVYEVKTTFETPVGKITQFWNTKQTDWKIKILRDSLGMQGDFDTDSAIGGTVDLRVTKKVKLLY